MPSPTPAPAPTRALVPHEHGAYGQLLMPLATGLAVGRPGLASALLAAAFTIAFVAHEPLLVVLGQRGKRALEADGPRARRLLALLGPAAAVLGAAGAALAPPAARVALAVPAALAAAVAALVVLRREKTLGGEVVVAAALASGGLVVALAAGVPLARAAALWAVWTLAFAAATLAVQVVLVRARSKGQRDPGVAHAAGAMLLLSLAFGAVALGGLPAAAAAALVPTAALSIVVCLARVPARRLRELGWAMVGTSALTLALLVVALR